MIYNVFTKGENQSLSSVSMIKYDINNREQMINIRLTELNAT